MLYRVRTITAFVTLPRLSAEDAASLATMKSMVDRAAHVLAAARAAIQDEIGAEVQTMRISLNPPDEWLGAEAQTDILLALDKALEANDISFCALGRMGRDMAVANPHLPSTLVLMSPRFNMSVDVPEGDEAAAGVVADSVVRLAAHSEGGLANFRLCSSSACKPGIPFFPASFAPSAGDNPGTISLAVGLESGKLAHAAFQRAETAQEITPALRQTYVAQIEPLAIVMEAVASKLDGVNYIGIDTSLNPGLDPGMDGSVAAAFERLSLVGSFGGAGSLAAAAAATRALRELSADMKTTGYCGLMLPVCEDRRLAELAAQTPSTLTITQLLSLSSVCGVGVDTVPVAGEGLDREDLIRLYLDVAGLAHRWDKQLSCRVFPVPGLKQGTMTAFDSPYLVNTRAFHVA